MNEEESRLLAARIKVLEEQIDSIKEILLNSITAEGHVQFSRNTESFLYSRIGDEK